MNKGLIALAAGTFALGMSEFVMMGILPDVAQDLSVSIPQAGHLISSYALGVCIGALSLIVLRTLKPKLILELLASVMLAGALLAVCSVNYPMLLAARFIEGLPHGAYFGVASIVAVRLADEGRKASAVAIMCAGMSVANLIGNPLATFLSSAVSWRLPFCVLMLVSSATILLLARWVPSLDAVPDNGLKGQFRFLKNLDPWLIIGATMLGNGGIFCWYSYISPLLQNQSGFSASVLPFLMVVAGLGMFIGNLAAGRLSDRYRPGTVTFCLQAIAAISLTAVFFMSGTGWLTVMLMFVLCACLFGIGSPEQLMIIEHAKGGEMLAGCCIQIAFNFGNAMGAFLGGLPIDAGLPYNYAALVGIPVAAAGAILMFIFHRRCE